MRLLALTLALLTLPVAAGQRVMLASDGDFIRLHDSPCVHAGTLALIPEKMRPSFRKATLRLTGVHAYGCWLDGGEVVLVLIEDGRAAQFERDMRRLHATRMSARMKVLPVGCTDRMRTVERRTAMKR
jgi:hypothetical protein